MAFLAIIAINFHAGGFKPLLLAFKGNPQVKYEKKPNVIACFFTFFTTLDFTSTQYNASPAITGAIKGTSRLKLYNEIGSESLKFRRWFRKLFIFYKIKSTGLPSYLYDLIPKWSHMYNTQSVEDVAMLYSRTDIFKYSFFPSTISEWNKLDLKI